jgi:hypothetical protein
VRVAFGRVTSSRSGRSGGQSLPCRHSCVL